MVIYLRVKADPIIESMWKLSMRQDSFTSQDLQRYIKAQGYKVPAMTLFHRLQAYVKKRVIETVGTSVSQSGIYNRYFINKEEFEKEIGKVV